MPAMGSNGPPDRIPDTADYIDISNKDIENTQRHEIGTGASSIVYRLDLQDQLQTSIALKQPDFSGTVTTERIQDFVDEAEVWTNLTTTEREQTAESGPTGQDYIVDVIDWGCTQYSSPWLALEYMDGGSLGDLIDETAGPIPLNQALWICLCVCRGVWHAHRHGVAHHDIKPSNILFRETATGWNFPKVTDWGVAKMMIHTENEAKGFTPEYAAPEQFSPREYGSPDESTDIYQIGTLAYRLITGELPFDGPTSELGERKLSTDPAPLSERGDVPEEFDDVLMPALERSKASRHDALVYLRDELQALFEEYKTEEGRPATTTNAVLAAGEETGSGTGSGLTGSELDNESDASDEAEDEFTDWDTYREVLDDQQANRLYALAPKSVQNIIYPELTTEVEQAGTQRAEAEEAFESIKTDWRSVRRFLENQVYDAAILNESLEAELETKLNTVRDIKDEATHLLTKKQKYLTEIQQDRLREIRSELEKYDGYLTEKRELNKAIDSLRETLDDVTADIDETIAEGTLLGKTEEQHILDDLDKVSSGIRHAKIEINSEHLRDIDIEQFESLVNEERRLREKVKNHNPELAQRRYSSLKDHVAAERNRVGDLVEQYQQSRRRVFDTPAVQIESVQDHEDEIDAFLASRNSDFLTPEQVETLEELRSGLRSYREWFESKAAFESHIETIETQLADLEATIDDRLDMETYLSNSELTELVEAIEATQAECGIILDEGLHSQLNERDRSRFRDCQIELARFDRRITEYNPTLVTQRYEEKTDRAKMTIDWLTTELEDSQTDGTPLPEPATTYIEATTEIHDELTVFRGTAQFEHLSRGQKNHVSDLRREVKQLQEFVESKSTFDTKIAAVDDAYTDLWEAYSNALDMSSYLTAPEREALKTEITSVRELCDEIVSADLLGPLAEADERKLRGYYQTLDVFETNIAAYNEAFVAQEADDYGELFTNLTEDNISLDEKQQSAIFKDEIHNRIIAGPGTGKTFSLACRIKYLIEKGTATDDILALAYNNHTADEITDRLNRLFNISDVTVRTLHSFGRSIIKDTRPNCFFLLGESRRREIEQIVMTLRKSDEEFQATFDEFLKFFRNEVVEKSDTTRDNTYRKIKNNKNKTKAGEELQGNHPAERDAHRRIADTLFDHNIDYNLYKYAPWADAPNSRKYIPDFTLPSHNICIEYLPAEAVRARKERYNRKPPVATLKQIFEDSKWELLTIHGENISTGTISKILKYQLEERGVSLGKKLSENNIKTKIYEEDQVGREVINKFKQFIDKAKKNQIDPAETIKAIDEDEEPMLYKFTRVATRVLDEYKQRYSEYEAFDFTDMVLEAKNILERGEASDSLEYDHILVDEFQDFNLAQIQLVQQILEKSGDAHLFAVGDDWQSIYGFKGARPEYFVDFEEHFSPAVTTRLNTNYRCPPVLVQASNELMSEIEISTEKSLEAADDTTRSRLSVHSVPGQNGYQYQTNAINKIIDLVEESLENPDRTPGDIMILARNERGSPYIPRIKSRLSKRNIPIDGPDSIKIDTAHGSKGNQAKHVIVVNVASEMNDGFPPTKPGSNLMAAVEANTDESVLAEERRLFYVAMTRAREDLDVQTRQGHKSSFVNVIEKYAEKTSIGFDFDQQRVSVTGRITDTADVPVGKQVGEIKLNGYEINFRIPNNEPEVEPLQQGTLCELNNVELDAYDGGPQLVIDGEADVVEK